ncbi:Vms1/Ankzf1 family peptidyl-tRNA hydrolase [Streptomyces sp. CRN 30]|uniref:baeRF2 domain-containing protein n=1 Tax=Streptomyces sp. CRN 30 TaxID=3075613 RepID=UPI002A7EB70F|nr:Vms1/Ankzf1 family peptidyl-tRNA hydrolase [Streptomyces sp. CRN 30]
MDLAFLDPLYEDTGPWASVYVDLSRRTENMVHERELTAEALSRQLAEQGADERTCHAVRDAVHDLRHSSDAHGRALFARDGRVLLDPPLARRPAGGSTAHWAPLPHTAPLLELAGEDPVCVVAYVDRRGADLELRSGALGSQDAGTVTGEQWPLHRTHTNAWSTKHFELKVENTWEQNAAEIAQALAACQEETRADLLILVGDVRERRAVHERLPKHLRGRVMETDHGAGSRLLDDDVERIRAEHVWRRAGDELDRFLAARDPGADGRAGAVEGVPAVIEAAREHRIEELLIHPDGPDAHREVWVGEDPDQLAVRRSDLRAIGEEHAWPARADDALLRAAAVTGAPALSVTPAGVDDAPVGGVGALLRWK